MQPVDLWKTPSSYRTAFPLTLILECDEIAQDTVCRSFVSRDRPFAEMRGDYGRLKA